MHHSILTSAPDAGKWSNSRSDRFPPKEQPAESTEQATGESGAGLDVKETKLSWPCRDRNPGPHYAQNTEFGIH